MWVMKCDFLQNGTTNRSTNRIATKRHKTPTVIPTKAPATTCLMV